MKLLNVLVGILALVVTYTASADSAQLGRALDMYPCDARVTLNEAGNGDLSVQFSNIPENCTNLTVSKTNGEVVKTYKVKGQSYTLSKKMLEALSSDCRVNLETASNSGRTSFSWYVYIPWCTPASSGPSGQVEFQLSNSGNCKLMVNGNYSNTNVDGAFCSYVSGKDMVTYEFSNRGNCKVMLNGSYSNQNTDSRDTWLCEAVEAGNF